MPFSVTLPSRSGRQYRLLRSMTLTDANWTEVESSGPHSTDGTTTLADTAIFDQAYYRIEVSMP